MGGYLQSEQGENLIDLQGISRVYSCGTNDIHALSNVSLNIQQGEFVAIMGPSASGKSTLLNIMGCLDTPSAGHYAIKGKRVDSLTKKEKAFIRNKVFGFVFQSFNLLSEYDIENNVTLPLKYSGIPSRQWKEMADDVLGAVGLDGANARFPDQLSGGQQQRAAIARALINKPDIILADEPTGNLDTMTGQEILEQLSRLRDQSGRTVVIVTHDSRIAAYADRIIRIQDGRIIEDIRLDNASPAKSLLKDSFRPTDKEEEYEKIL